MGLLSVCSGLLYVVIINTRTSSAQKIIFENFSRDSHSAHQSYLHATFQCFINDVVKYFQHRLFAPSKFIFHIFYLNLEKIMLLIVFGNLFLFGLQNLFLIFHINDYFAISFIKVYCIERSNMWRSRFMSLLYLFFPNYIENSLCNNNVCTRSHKMVPESCLCPLES